MEKLRRIAHRFLRGNSVPEVTESVRPTRIIVMPGARMTQTPRGTWRFPHVAPNKTNTDTSGFQDEVSAGTSKIRAIEKIYKEQRRTRPNENILVLVTGGNEPSGHSRSDEAREQLTHKYGLLESSVVSLGGVGQTIGNAKAVVDYMRTHADSVKGVSTIEIVENEYKLLRAWLMFSAAVYTLETGRELVVSDTDREAVTEILFSGNVGRRDDAEIHMSHANQAMRILEHYFGSLRIKVRPIVVEEMIENKQSPTLAPARKEYVARLRSHPSVLARLNQENQGVMDFLDGKYKML